MGGAKIGSLGMLGRREVCNYVQLFFLFLVYITIFFPPFFVYNGARSGYRTACVFFYLCCICVFYCLFAEDNAFA